MCDNLLLTSMPYQKSGLKQNNFICPGTVTNRIDVLNLPLPSDNEVSHFKIQI